MKLKYDAILGTMREYDGPPAPKTGMVLHLPRRVNGDDASKNKRTPTTAGNVVFVDNWATFSEQRSYQLHDVNFAGATIACNLQIPLNADYADIFGLESDQHSFYFQKRFGSEIVIETMNGSFDFNIEAAADNKPFHLAATFNGTQIRCFLNGVQFATDNFAMLLMNPACNIWPSSIKMSDLRLYNEALSDKEILSIYQADKRTQ